VPYVRVRVVLGFARKKKKKKKKKCTGTDAGMSKRNACATVLRRASYATCLHS
jgi:hypothetical protein